MLRGQVYALVRQVWGRRGHPRYLHVVSLDCFSVDHWLTSVVFGMFHHVEGDGRQLYLVQL